MVFSWPEEFVFTLKMVTNIPGLSAIYPLIVIWVYASCIRWKESGERKVVKLSIVSTAGQGQKEDEGIVKWIQGSIIGLVSTLVSFSQAEVRNTPSQSRGQIQDAELRFVAIKLKSRGNLLDFWMRRHREEGMGIWSSEGRWAHAKSFGENGCLDFHWI